MEMEKGRMYVRESEQKVDDDIRRLTEDHENKDRVQFYQEIFGNKYSLEKVRNAVNKSARQRKGRYGASSQVLVKPRHSAYSSSRQSPSAVKANKVPEFSLYSPFINATEHLIHSKFKDIREQQEAMDLNMSNLSIVSNDGGEASIPRFNEMSKRVYKSKS